MRRKVELSEIDGDLAKQYEAKMQETMQELRDQYEEQISSNRAKIEDIYKQKVNICQCTNFSSGLCKIAYLSFKSITLR